MLVVKVINSNTMLQKGVAVSPLLRNTRIAECLIGDDTASILFTTRNDQVDLMKPGSSVILRYAMIDMSKGTMRLDVDKWIRIEVIVKLKMKLFAHIRYFKEFIVVLE
ncbi:hypothetical protein ACS0TY_027473 [Phlomoides rotata]